MIMLPLICVSLLNVFNRNLRTASILSRVIYKTPVKCWQRRIYQINKKDVHCVNVTLAKVS